MSSGHRPPRLVRFLIGLLVPSDQREYLLGDLEESSAGDPSAGGYPSDPDRASWRRAWWWEAAGALQLRLGRRGSRRQDSSTRRRERAMGGLLGDLRHGVRRLRKNPGIACLAIVAFALGVGSTTTMFCVSHGLLRKMPYEQVDRMASVSMRPSDGRRLAEIWLSVHELTEWGAQQSTLEGLAAFQTREFNLSGAEGRPERVRGGVVTANAIEMLRVRPFLGRGFLPEDERPGAEPVVVLGHRLWSTRHRGERDVIGTTVRLHGIERTVVGVMPEGFRFPYEEDLWVPLEVDPGAVERGTGRYLRGFGRLREGVSLDEAQAEFAGLMRRLQLAYPDKYEGVTERVIPFQEHIVEPEDTIFLNALVGLVSFVLLIACANVASLLLARAAGRARELAVLTALGASRARVVGQLLAESLVLSFLGGGAGFCLAWLGVSLVDRVAASAIPYPWMQVRMDFPVLLFTIALVLLAGVIAGIVPALKATDVNVNDVLKDEGRGATGLRLGRLSRVLVVGEVALSCALLTISGLMMKGTLLLTAGDLPFAAEDFLTARVTLNSMDYPEVGDGSRFFQELLSRLNAQPGVRSAALTSALPGVNYGAWLFQLEGQAYGDPGDSPQARAAIISPEFFRTLGVSVIQGRGFTVDDNAESEPVAIVNQRFADMYFPGESPLGRRLKVEVREPEGAWITIVGVAPNLAMNRRAESDSEGFYVPLSQHVRFGSMLMVRAQGDPLAQTPAVREVVASLDPHLPVYETSTLAREISRVTLDERTITGLFVAFGLAALLLATVGLFGVMAFTVRRRTREIGIRMALGALSKKVLWLTLRGGLAQVTVGLILGAGLAALIAPGMTEVSYDASPWDWKVYLLIALCLGATGVAATLIPAGRATRVDPVETLRYE